MANDPDLDKLGEAVNKSGARLDCPSCGNKTWLPHERPVVLPASDKGSEGFVTLSLVCDRCGFVRLHAAAVLDQYIDPRSS